LTIFEVRVPNPDNRTPNPVFYMEEPMIGMRQKILMVLIPLVLIACQSAKKKNGEAAVIERVKIAMLCMQRASWEQGVAMQGLIEIGDTLCAVNMAREAVLRRKPDGRLSMVGSDWNVSDPASNGPGVLFAFRVTGDETFRKAAEAQYRYLLAPSSRTPKGFIRHNSATMQVWSDNAFMAFPFLAMMGDAREAVGQIEGMRESLWDGEAGLFRHIWDEEKRKFDDKSHWGGGNGWNAAAMAQVIDLLPAGMKADRLRLISYEKELIDGCLRHMRQDGFFFDKIDEPNFVETNLGQMLAYSIYKGIRSGWLDRSYLNAADRMRGAAWTKIDRHGFIQGASGSPSFDRPGTSTECQAFFLMMEGERRKLGH
jgi:unsaturated rhamnogalacturonyl hydrolase